MNCANLLDSLKSGIGLVAIILFLALPIIVGVVLWFLIDPSTAIEKILSIFACGFISLLTFIGVILFIAVVV